MNSRLELLEYQIALLELCEVRIDPDSIHIPGHIRRSGWTVPYLESQSKRKKAEKRKLQQRIAYLKRHHYIELIKDGEERLFQLTSKAQYEILRLNFLIQMWSKKSLSHGQVFYLIVFDIPERLAKYRATFRRLLKAARCIMLQRSVWLSRVNPQPSIDELLRYLEIERYFEIMEVECKKCSVRLQKRVRKS